MEASSCLITPPSKPSCCNRGLDPLPSLKPRATVFNRNSRRPSKSPIITCCSGLNGNGEVSVSSDWRAFRARLVAVENAPPPPAPPVELGDKWAHPLHVPEKGCLLLATRKLDGVHIFERAVVLVLAVSPTRALGVILNRPSLMSITSTSAAAFPGCPLFFGGPVKEEGLFLSRGKGGSGVLEEVMEGLCYGTREVIGCASEMVKRGAVGLEELLFFDGCCGWERVQLDEEVRAGYWSVVACSAGVVASVAAGAEAEGGSGVVWEEVAGLAGGRRMW